MNETFLMMLIVGAFLAFVNIVAYLMRNGNRKTEREKLETVVRERSRITSKTAVQPSPPRDPPPDPAPALPASFVPAKPTPPPKSLLAWKPHDTSPPTHFARYIAWPNTKLTTPVAERTPSEQDYVWD